MKPARPATIDRHLACQEAMNDRLFALMSEAAAAGWSEKQVAEAVQDLTVSWRRWRRERRATEARIAAAQALHRQ